MAYTPDLRRLKRVQFALTFIYGVISMILFVATFALINFLSSFQLATIATVHLITGVMIFLLISYNAVDRAILSSDRTVFSDTRGASKFKEQFILRLYKIAAVFIVVVTFITTIALAVYLYNLIVILFIECPRFDHHHHQHNTHSFARLFKADRRVNPERQHLNTTLDIIVSYSDQEEHQHILLLKYDTEEKQIIQKSRPPQSQGWHDSHIISLKQSQSPICTEEKFSDYHFLESEIRDALAHRIHEFNSQQSILIQSHQNSHQTHPVEDSLILELQTRYICRNEYGFVAVIITVILAIELYNVAVSSWFIYLRVNIP
jgi:hypothetical protein